jgi:hypothetical protein
MRSTFLVVLTMTLSLQRQQPQQSQAGSNLAWRWAAFCVVYAVINAWQLRDISVTYSGNSSQQQQQQQQHSVNTKGSDPISPPSDSAVDITTAHASPKVEPVALLNRRVIQDYILKEAPWAESHGADHGHYLGAGLLYYATAYAFQSQTIVVLGSGGGFAPRLLRQAQRDLELAGITGKYQLILIDAHMAAAGWGSTFYATNTDTIMRKQFADIRYIFEKTDTAVEMLRRENVRIDYLHVDADHSYEQSLLDFTNYFDLLAPRAVVSFHDTCRDAGRKCKTGVAQMLETVRQQSDKYRLQLLDAHYLYRGIALAIRQEAPALEAPANRRRNFCQTNAAVIDKVSEGFSMNARKGSLSTLGDFYDCHKRFNMTALGLPCPAGRQRREKHGDCSQCVPGLKGQDCDIFSYQDERTRQLELVQTNERKFKDAVDLEERNNIVAAWLGQDGNIAQHILELGSISKPVLADQLWHQPKSVWSVAAGIIEPSWSDDYDEKFPRVRRLPISYPHLFNDQGRYFDVLPRSALDTLVCLQCEYHLMDDDDDHDHDHDHALKHLGALVRSLPRLRTIVLDVPHSNADNKDNTWLDLLGENDVSAKTHLLGWQVENDILLDSKRTRKHFPDAIPRRMVRLIKY